MRISDQQIIALTQSSMNDAYERLADAQKVLATGHSINQPSDNPLGAAVAVDLQGHIAQNTAFGTAADDTLSWLQTTSTSLSGVGDALTQARTLAVQGANDTLSPSDRKALASSVMSLLQGAVQSANGDYDGRYVLGGFQTDKPPFVLNTSGGSPTVTYQGDGQAIQREILPGQTLQVNVPGSTALPAVFSALAGLYNDLQSGASASTISGDIQTIDNAHDGLMVTQTTVGAAMDRVRAVQQTIQTQGLTLTGQLSNLVDADMAQAATDFSTRQAAYQAALSVAAKVIQPSLLQFLQ